MKKPDLSKQGLKRFFLYHSEKLVLGLAILLLGLFFWLGFSAPVFNKKTPTQLTELARQADQYIVSETNWEKISVIDVRKADDKIVAKITEGSTKVDAAKYPFGFWSVKALTLGLRSDPALLEPQELMAFQMVAPVLFSPKTTVVDPFGDLPLAKANIPTIDSGLGSPRGLGDLSESPGDRRGGGREEADEKKKKEPPALVIDAGSSVLPLHQQTTPGLRPPHFGFSNSTEQAFIMNIVSVTGLVNFKNQWTDYESSFASSIGFYPTRDKPKYLYVEVQRADVTGGKEAEWQDISENVAVKQTSFYPSKMTRMPQASFTSAPEIISEDAWDNILTGPIPPIVQVDYRPFVTHPKIENRKFDPLPKMEKGKEISDADAMFSDPATADGKPAQTDQNVPGLGDMGASGFGGPTRTDIVRSGSNVIKYKTALAAKKAMQDYKLMRFFDLQAKPGATYRYRVRLWLADPNNEASGEDAVALRAGSPGRSGPGQAGGNRDQDDGGMGQIGGGVGGLGGRGGRGGSEGEGGAPLGGAGAGQGAGEAESQYTHVAITSQMRDPLVRKRLDLARQVPDPKDPKKITYFVTEFRKTAEGEVSEEVQVPVGHDELRFARPTIWSQPVEVAVKSEMSSVIAGKVVPVTKKKFGAFELAEGEPTAEVVSTVLNKKYNAVLPAKKTTYRAEALDFSADIHVVNSVTWGVHVYKHAPILTDSVVVDMLGGDELPLNGSEKMRFSLPGEMLIMKADGTFQIANDLDDRTKYVQALLRDDDSMEVGGEKAERQKKREKEQEDNRRGAGGGESPGGRGGS